MKLRQQMEQTQKKYLLLLKCFLMGATVVALIGIFLVKKPGFMEDARYLTILSATLACQGVWGFVLFDCMHRRLGKE